ncbi:MAG: putative glycosyltransferase EpsJ [Deltaproteobacteria bacterium]|nr:putative glycosyltransferase EpsJ [Deltaproteobacteria bacterium]
MPVRSDAAMLPDCLEDIQSQTVSEIEIVIVDDGSSDETPELLKRASNRDSRIRVIRTKPRGIISALNTGLAECKGKYIARIDADDRMVNTRLVKQLELMTSDPELELIGCRMEGFTDSGRITESIEKYQSWSNSLISHEQIEIDLFAECPIAHPTFFATRDLLNKLDGYSPNPWAEDYDLILRAYGTGAKFAKHPEKLVRKFHASGRLSRIESIYKRPAMFEAKAHYLLELGFLNKRRGVLIAGSGPTGRQAAHSFAKRGINILGFVDNRPGPPDRLVKSWPAWGFTDLPPAEFLDKFRDALVILAIGDSEGQRAFAELLRKLRFVENRDYVRVIYNWPPASADNV